MATLTLAYLAGLLTTLNPCVLPMLPVLLASAIDRHRHGPLVLAAGLCLSFTVFGVFVASTGFAIGLDHDTLRTIAAVLMAIFGVILLSSSLQAGVSLATAGAGRFAGGILQRHEGVGLSGQFLTGVLLGVIWIPCTGPTLGAAIALAGQSGGSLEAGVTMAVFSLGAATVLVLLTYGSREVLQSRKTWLAQAARHAKPAIGIIFLFLGAVILLGLDRQLEIALIAIMPEWLMALTIRF